MSKTETAVTRTDVEEIVDRVVKNAVDDLTGVIRDFALHVDERFNANEAAIFGIRNELGETRSDIAGVRHDIRKLTSTIDGFVKRLDSVETEATARDAQFCRLLDWAQKVSKKTGIPLEY